MCFDVERVTVLHSKSEDRVCIHTNIPMPWDNCNINDNVNFYATLPEGTGYDFVMKHITDDTEKINIVHDER
jgi:hypothetical protein